MEHEYEVLATQNDARGMVMILGDGPSFTTIGYNSWGGGVRAISALQANPNLRGGCIMRNSEKRTLSNRRQPERERRHYEF